MYTFFLFRFSEYTYIYFPSAYLTFTIFENAHVHRKDCVRAQPSRALCVSAKDSISVFFSYISAFIYICISIYFFFSPTCIIFRCECQQCQIRFMRCLRNNSYKSFYGYVVHVRLRHRIRSLSLCRSSHVCPRQLSLTCCYEATKPIPVAALCIVLCNVFMRASIQNICGNDDWTVPVCRERPHQRIHK